MTLEPQEIGSGKNVAARSPQLEFAVVLARIIESVERDPAQLRNAVYKERSYRVLFEWWRDSRVVRALE